MKKALFVALMAVASIAIASAQPRAIGGNIGGGIGLMEGGSIENCNFKNS